MFEVFFTALIIIIAAAIILTIASLSAMKSLTNGIYGKSTWDDLLQPHNRPLIYVVGGACLGVSAIAVLLIFLFGGCIPKTAEFCNPKTPQYHDHEQLLELSSATDRWASLQRFKRLDPHTAAIRHARRESRGPTYG